MVPNLNAKSNPPTAKLFNPPPPPPSSKTPSVPISLYREVAAELQSTRSSMETLQSSNKTLTEQNQQLRVEIERVVQSALRLRQLADVRPTNEADPLSLENLIAEYAPSTPPVTPIAPDLEQNDELISTKQHTEQSGGTRQASLMDRMSELNGGWLALLVILIGLSAFGAGFVIVRPLLPSR